MERRGLPLLAILLLVGISGCRSRVITITITNQSAAVVRNVELTFPGGSYGLATLPPGALRENRIKPFFAGRLELAYLDEKNVEHRVAGPQVRRDQEGMIAITFTLTGAKFE